MAAGSHGGYRDNEFKDRESDFNVSSQEFARSKEERVRAKYGNHEVRIRDRRDEVRVNKKDIKKKEVVNGGYRSSSSRSDSGSGGGPKRSAFSVRNVDREPGELSSGSGSDDAVDSGRMVKGMEESSVENGNRSPSPRKRKFTPIVWDREDNNYSKDSSGTVASIPGSLPPLPPMSRLSRQPPNSVTVPVGGSPVLPTGNDKLLISESSLVEPLATTGSIETDVSASPVRMIPSEKHLNNDHEDEDFIPTRHISSSRWADEDSSPRDEGKISDSEGMRKRRKKMPLSESVEMRIHIKSRSPELGEVKREGSDSDDHWTRSRSSSKDVSPANVSKKNDLMDVDEAMGSRDTSSVSRSDSEDIEESCETPEPAVPPQRSVNMLQGCRSVDEFERLNKIDEGTYGVVYRAKDKKTGEIVALKKVKMEKEREGFPLTSLREINVLLSIHHPSIVDVKEVVIGSNLDSIFMVMEYMEHDLKALMETMKQPFSQSEVKCLMLQLLGGVKYLHDNWVLHRDLKTSNLLLNNRGELKICDLGLARQYGSPLKPYTHLVVTLWYRAPELLLGAKQYSTAIDMWSLGCIMAELLSKAPLFNGKTELEQLDKIFRTLGTPNETIWPGFSKLPRVKVNFVKHQYNLLRKKFPATSFTGSPVLSDAGFDLLNKLLTYDPDKRITAEAALNHEWFCEVPLPKSKDFMPTFPAQHAQDRRVRRVLKSPDPLEEQRRKELQQVELGTGGLFG